MREYRRGATIDWHTDPAESQPLTVVFHLAHDHNCEQEHELDTTNGSSATCNNDDNENENDDWSFDLATFSTDDLSVSPSIESIQLAEGQAIVFESARVAHSRTKPLLKNWYGNVFVHMKPADWDEFIMEQL